MRASSPSVSVREAAIVAAATVACLLPFLDKAFFIDDPLNLWVARQIWRDPLDFFALSVNWSGVELPYAAESKNPPLVSFYTAAAGGLLGWKEVALHGAFLLPALGVTLATWALARRLCADPLLAALTCLTLPVFLVSATTLMADVPMLALFCLSVLCWMRGVETRRHAWLLAGALLASLCALTKYFGLALLPLLAAWSLARERRLGPWALYLLLPVAILGAYEAYTAARYGSGLVQRAAGYSLLTRPGETGGLERAVLSLVFAGGVLAPLLFAAPLALSRRMALASAGLAVALCAASLLLDPLGGLAFGPDGADANLILHVAFFSAAAGAVAALVAADLARRRDADALLLALWTLGTAAFGAWLNYTTNARTLLPMAPALAIALVRGLDARRVPPLLRYAALVPAAALALGVAWGDAALADAARRAARRIAVGHADEPGMHWFEGHWGFQLYLERAGWRPVDLRRSALRPGDLLASPLGWKLRLDVPEAAAEELDVFGIRTAPITTMAPETATGFHAIQWGPLPYRFLPGHVERFEVRRLTEVVIFETDPDAVERRRQALERADAWLAALRRLGGGARSAPCPPEFAADAADACRWCASPEECATCLAKRAARRDATPECVERLGAELERALTPQPRARPGR